MKEKQLRNQIVLILGVFACLAVIAVIAFCIIDDRKNKTDQPDQTETSTAAQSNTAASASTPADSTKTAEKEDATSDPYKLYGEILDMYETGWPMIGKGKVTDEVGFGDVDYSYMPKYLQSYKAPSSSYDITKAQFLLDGKAYMLPCPIKEFIDDGWELDTSGQEAGVGEHTSDAVTIKKNGYSLQVGVANYMLQKDQIIEFCCAYYVTFNRSEQNNKGMPDDFIRFADGIDLNYSGQTTDDKLSALGFIKANNASDNEGEHFLYKHDTSILVDLCYKKDSVFGAIVGTEWKYDDPVWTEYDNEFCLKYKEYLNNIDTSEDIHFAFGYIDDGDIPELLYSYGNNHVFGVHVCSYDSNTDKVVYIGEFSSFGQISYGERANRITSQYGNQGYYSLYVTEIKDYKPVLVGSVTEDGSGIRDEDFLYYAGYPAPETMDGTKRDVNDDDLKGASEEYLVSEDEYGRYFDQLTDDGTGRCYYPISISYDEMHGQIIDLKKEAMEFLDGGWYSAGILSDTEAGGVPRNYVEFKDGVLYRYTATLGTGEYGKPDAEQIKYISKTEDGYRIAIKKEDSDDGYVYESDNRDMEDILDCYGTLNFEEQSNYYSGTSSLYRSDSSMFEGVTINKP